jgi:hypothetical protein
MLDLRPLLRHHLRHLPWYFFLWIFFLIFFCHHELFGLQATLEFWCIESEPVHPPSGMSLRMVLTSMRSALRRRVFGSILIVTTRVGYLGRKGFELILQCPKLILLVLPQFSVKFAFRLRELRSWLVTTTVWPTTHVLQANCRLLLMCCLRVCVHPVHVCKAIAPPHSQKATEL